MSGKHGDVATGAGRKGLHSEGSHHEAVPEAEVKRLVNALAPYGVLRSDALRREAGADRWHEPCFERALDAAANLNSVGHWSAWLIGRDELPGAIR
jgi:hypothetical protein